MTGLIRRRPVLSVAVGMLVLFSVAGIWFRLGVRGVGQAAANITPDSGKQFVEVFREELDLLNEKRGWLRADTRSVGFPDREQKLEHLSEDVAWFVGTFRRPPVTLYELPELFQPWPGLKSGGMAAQYAEFARDCAIWPFPDDSFVLNCDQWKPESVKRFFELEKGFEEGIQRFYRLGDHVLLYVPSGAQADVYAQKHPIRITAGPNGHLRVVPAQK